MTLILKRASASRPSGRTSSQPPAELSQINKLRQTSDTIFLLRKSASARSALFDPRGIRLRTACPGNSTAAGRPALSENNVAEQVQMIFNVIRLVMVVVAIGLPGTSVWGQDRYAITGIQARLFFHGTGEIGTVDLLDGREHALWNTFIGEGDAGKPSSATLVLVALSGPTFADAPGQLAVKATAGKKTLL